MMLVVVCRNGPELWIQCKGNTYYTITFNNRNKHHNLNNTLRQTCLGSACDCPWCNDTCCTRRQVHFFYLLVASRRKFAAGMIPLIAQPTAYPVNYLAGLYTSWSRVLPTRTCISEHDRNDR